MLLRSPGLSCISDVFYARFIMRAGRREQRNRATQLPNVIPNNPSYEQHRELGNIMLVRGVPANHDDDDVVEKIGSHCCD